MISDCDTEGKRKVRKRYILGQAKCSKQNENVADTHGYGYTDIESLINEKGDNVAWTSWHLIL